ncbi:MAG TPA: hypothetical protein DCW29_08115 [Janthinobacterium sp.]|nr:hypothetical protein [Janthinobacterium sp.]
MTRILFWLALAFLVLMALRSKVKDIVQPGPTARPAAPPAEVEAEAMLCCVHCGVHYPASETVSAKGRDYCSAAHAGLA